MASGPRPARLVGAAISLVLAASAIRWAAAVSDCSAMAARCTTVNSVVTVISSERDVIIVKTLGLRLCWISFLRLLSPAGVVALADHLDLVDAHFQRGSFSAVPVLPLAQIDFAGYCDLRPFGQILCEPSTTFAEQRALRPDRVFLSP